MSWAGADAPVTPSATATESARHGDFAWARIIAMSLCLIFAQSTNPRTKWDQAVVVPLLSAQEIGLAIFGAFAKAILIAIEQSRLCINISKISFNYSIPYQLLIFIFQNFCSK